MATGVERSAVVSVTLREEHIRYDAGMAEPTYFEHRWREHD